MTLQSFISHSYLHWHLGSVKRQCWIWLFNLDVVLSEKHKKDESAYHPYNRAFSRYTMEGKMSMWSIVQSTIKLNQWATYYLSLFDCNMAQCLWTLSGHCWAQWMKNNKRLWNLNWAQWPKSTGKDHLTISPEAPSGRNTRLPTPNTPTTNLLAPSHWSVQRIKHRSISFWLVIQSGPH